MAKKLMNGNLYLECFIPVVSVQLEVFRSNERNALVRYLGTKNITQRDVLKTVVSPNVFVIRDVDACRNTRTCKG